MIQIWVFHSKIIVLNVPLISQQKFVLEIKEYYSSLVLSSLMAMCTFLSDSRKFDSVPTEAPV
jgi:hypothetical protein